MRIGARLGSQVVLAVSVAVLMAATGAGAQDVPDDVEPGCWHECLQRAENWCQSPNPDGSPGPACVGWCRDACNENNPLCSDREPPSSTTSTTLPAACLESLCGDLNGDDQVSASDCQACLFRAVSLPVSLICILCHDGACGDFNGDDFVSASDCQACLLRAVAVPVGLACDGEADPAISYTRDCRPY